MITIKEVTLEHTMNLQLWLLGFIFCKAIDNVEEKGLVKSQKRERENMLKTKIDKIK